MTAGKAHAGFAYKMMDQIGPRPFQKILENSHQNAAGYNRADQYCGHAVSASDCHQAGTSDGH